MAGFNRKVSRTVIKDTLKRNDIPRQLRAHKMKQLQRVGDNVSITNEKKALNLLSLAKIIIDNVKPIEEDIEDIFFKEEFNKVVNLLMLNKDYVNGLNLKISTTHSSTLELTSERIKFYINEINSDTLNIALVSLLVPILEDNIVYGKNILVHQNELAAIVYSLLKYIEIEYNFQYTYSCSLQKKIVNIENDYGKNYVLKSMMKNINNLILDFVDYLELTDKDDHIIEVSSELLTRAVEVSNTYSLMDSSYKEDKRNLAIIIRLSYFYVIFKEYEEKHNNLKSAILKKFNSYFQNHPEYKQDKLNIEVLSLLNTAVNYECNSTEFFTKYVVTKEEIVKPIFKIFYVALSDLLTITRIMETYSENILVDQNGVSKDTYLKELLNMLNEYRVFMCCNVDNLNSLTKLYYLTYAVEKVALTNFIADLNIITLEKFIKKHGFFKKYKNYIVF